MLELALDFERLSIYLDWRVLVIPGVLMVVFGILLWLAGSVKHRLFASVFMGLCGLAVAGYFSSNIVGMAVSVFAGLVFGAILDKKAIIIAAGLTAFLAAVFFIYFLGFQESPPLNRYYSGLEQQRNLADSIDFIEEYSVFVFRESQMYIEKLDIVNLSAAVGISALFLVLGWLFSKSTVSFVCSFWGAVLICEGMCWLLLYKGTKIATRINENINMYLYVFGGMIIFGFLVQRLLCPVVFGRGKKSDKDTVKDNGDEK